MARGKFHKTGNTNNTKPATASTTQPLPRKSKPSQDASVAGLRKEIQKHLDDFPSNSKTSQPVRTASSSLKASETSSNKSSSSKANRGIKRDRSGNAIPVKQANGRGATHGVEDENTLENFEDTLEKEIRALGGTAEDIDLIEDAQSDSEMEGTDGATVESSKKMGDTNGLSKGISNILKEIALAQGNQDDVETPGLSELDSIPKPTKPQSGKDNAYGSSSISNSTQGKKGKAALRVSPRSDWFNTVLAPIKPSADFKHSIPQQTLEELRAYAMSLLEHENQAFRTTQQSSSSQAFYETVVSSGTLSDKISALTLAVQESPLHNVHALESLISLASKRARSQAIDCLRALKDLFGQGSLLPSDRKLQYFTTQPGLLSAFHHTKTWRKGETLPAGLTEAHLILWVFESWVKEQYFEILRMLEMWCGDEIEFAKSRAVSYVYELLKEKPEQEANLLRLLVNKLGDPVKKIASQTSYLLVQLLAAHPAMKMTVISAIENDFIFRPGQSMHGKYYATVTINQTALSSKEEDVAVKLLGIYFGLFTALLKSHQTETASKPSETTQSRQVNDKSRPVKASPEGTKTTSSDGEELRERLISAILTGVNRAYPYTGPENQSFSQHLDTLFTVAHSSNFNTSVQALLLIQQLSTSHRSSDDRFYRVLYESLLDQRLITASKQQLYLNLVHRALKADLNIKRVKAFIKRILQILCLHEPPFICGVFFLLQDLQKSIPSLSALITQAEDHDEEEEIFKDVDEDADDQPNGVGGTKKGLDGSSGPGNHYDAHKRAPEHANAENSCLWELLPLLAHYHPAVSVSADHLLRQTKLPGKPDLTLHSLIHFLDRFVYRNPKLNSSALRGSSIMQPMASDDAHSVLIHSTTGSQKVLAVNSDEFKSQASNNVAAQDVFFHQYFTTLGKDAGRKPTKSKTRDRGDEDEQSGDEDEVWKAMIESAPDLEGDDEDDEDDIGLSDLESDLDDDDDLQIGDDDEEEEGVDIEAGIFDDTDDEMNETAAGLEAASDFEGLDDEDVSAIPLGKIKAKQHSSKAQRKKLKNAPTFASAEDYAKMLEDDDGEDIG